MSGRDAGSKTCMSCSFRLAPRRGQVPKRRIFEAQPPDTDSLQPVLVHQRQLAAQRVGALNPELMVDAEGGVAGVHFFLDCVEGRRGPMSLGSGPLIGVLA